MSQVEVNLLCRFGTEEEADFFEKGFNAVHESRFAEAKTHFATKGVELWIADDDSPWWLEQHDRDGRYLSGLISARTHTFDEKKFLKDIANHGATHILASTFNDQVGEGTSVATLYGKRAAWAKVTREICDENKNFALGLAVAGGNSKEVMRLLEEGANPSGLFFGSAHLPTAVFNERKKIFEVLLAAGADPNGTMKPNPKDCHPPGRETALHACAENGSGGTKKMIKQLLEAGADPNKGDGDGRTPLHYLVSYQEYYENAALLIEHGATLNEPKDIYGDSPFITFLSSAYDNNDIFNEKKHAERPALKLFDLMLAKGVDVLDHGGDGGNAYWYAGAHRQLREQIATLGCATMVRPNDVYSDVLRPNTKFYSSNVKAVVNHYMTAIHFRDRDGLLALMSRFDQLTQEEKDAVLEKAIELKRFDYACILADGGADPNYQRYQGKPLYELAARHCDNPEQVAYLKERAAPSISRQKERFDRACDFYLSFERWYVGLGDRVVMKPELMPYYSDRFILYRGDHLHSSQYAPRFLAMINDNRGDPFVFPRSDGDLMIGRKFLLNDEERAMAFHLKELDGEFLFHDVDMSYTLFFPNA